MKTGSSKYPSFILGYTGFRKTILENGNLDDTLANMKRIALRDYKQVAHIAQALQGDSVEQTAENIWKYLRQHTKYKLDKVGIEELRTPARSLFDGRAGLKNVDYVRMKKSGTYVG